MHFILEILAAKNIPKRPLAPSTKKCHGEVEVLLAAGYGGQQNFFFSNPCESC
jgi:hypothetical protein